MDASKRFGLTTTRAAFIDEAVSRKALFIEQPYELYSEDNQEAWKKLWQRLKPLWEGYASKKFLEGLERLRLNQGAIPHLREVNKILEPLTGFKARPVSGYVPGYIFFDSLKERIFPTTITIRDSQTLDYLPEPDIFHDVAGHVPMHTDPVFAQVLVKFGSLASQAKERFSSVRDPEIRVERIKSVMLALSRCFWFTIEFGLIRQEGALKAYGSGLLSSAGEIVHSIKSGEVQRFPLQLEWVINQGFEIDHYQPLLFVIESFEHLYEELERLECWLHAGKLDHVAPGEPAIDDESLQAFLDMGGAGDG